MDETTQALFDAFPRQRLVVIGDVMLDRFIWGNVSRISPEAPVPVVEVQRESFYPGGAANVASRTSLARSRDSAPSSSRGRSSYSAAPITAFLRDLTHYLYLRVGEDRPTAERALDVVGYGAYTTDLVRVEDEA